MDGKQDAEAVELLDADANASVHCDAYEVFRSPPSEFRGRSRRRGCPTGSRTSTAGETHRFAVPADRR